MFDLYYIKSGKSKSVVTKADQWLVGAKSDKKKFKNDYK